ncbi:alpha/beta fold hydrolase [Micromonospora sp. CPCC 206061]|uniref:alpha/beta fold hydrolase n=1 Tax=Micromonospora sp. CPCC 206061 TaxID=3122410 RepID=UPI002FF068BE
MRAQVPLTTGVTLRYSVQGTGAPVVLLHPWSESLGCFDRLLPLLPATIRAYAVDQRGHGEADARLVVYEDTGHLVLWERPDRVAHDS